jgi:leucyl-tRNA synthetase
MKLIHQGIILGEDNQKMSKSRGNVINPDDVVNEYGADAMRLFEMFMGPLEATKPWKTAGVDGVRRLLDRIWRLAVDPDTGELRAESKPAPDEIQKALHRTIKKVTEDIEGMRFNTAIASMMELTNLLTKSNHHGRETLEILVQLMAPFAPHFSEELWERLGHQESIAYVTWPQYDPALIIDQTQTYAVAINGKMRAQIDLPRDVAKDDALAQARVLENIQRHIEGKTIRKEIFVPGRMINFVVG